MSYVLKENNEQIAISTAWHPSLFAKHTGTSYPAEVTQEYVWEQDDYWLGWVEDEVVEPSPETPEETTARLELALDIYIDEQARSFRYESIRTMVTYVGDPNLQFNAEGVGALNFRSNCYTLALMIMNEVSQGRPVPTEAELIAEMPKITDYLNYVD